MPTRAFSGGWRMRLSLARGTLTSLAVTRFESEADSLVASSSAVL